jgi:hypothetical protein
MASFDNLLLLTTEEHRRDFIGLASWDAAVLRPYKASLRSGGKSPFRNAPATCSALR